MRNQQQRLLSNPDKYEEVSLLAQTCLLLVERFNRPTTDLRTKEEIEIMLGMHAYAGIYLGYNNELIAVVGGDWHPVVQSAYVVSYMHIVRGVLGAENSMPLAGYDGLLHPVRTDHYIGPKYVAMEHGQGIELKRLIARACAGEFGS